MSAVVKSEVPESTRTVRLYSSGTSGVTISISDIFSTVSVSVQRDALLAAVESEFGVRLVPADAIVIDRADLPEVTECSPGRDGFATVGGRIWAVGDASAHHATALRHLAVAEYLGVDLAVDVDEADVKALVLVAMRNQRESCLMPDPVDTDSCIRALLASGKVTVTRP